MKNGHKIAALGCLAVVVGSIACWRWMIRIPLKKFTRYALYMVVMDDAICRNKPEGNQTEDTVIAFPPRRESLQEGIPAGAISLLLGDESKQDPSAVPGGNHGHGAAILLLRGTACFRHSIVKISCVRNVLGNIRCMSRNDALLDIVYI